MTLFIDTSAT